MNAGREEGFTYHEEKGLFTFYREQAADTVPKPVNDKEEEKYCTDRQSRLPLLTPHRDKSPPLSFIALTAHSVITNPIYHSPPAKSQSISDQASRIPKLTLSMNHNHSTKRQQPQHIVQFSFDLTNRKEKGEGNHKARAKTEASSNIPLGESSPLRQIKQRQIQRKELNFEYGSEWTKQKKLKIKAVLKLDSSKKLAKFSMDDRHLRPQSDHLVVNQLIHHQRSNIKPVELLPQIQAEGQSISFWEYFQERKNLFLGRYKRERAGRHQGQSTRAHKPKTIKLSLTNNHI